MLGKPTVHARSIPGLSVGKAAATVQEQFLVACEPVLMTGHNALQRKIWRRGTQPGRVGRRVWLDMRHASFGKRLHQSWVADQRLGLIFGAAIRGQEPLICLDDLRGHQAIEQATDAVADRDCPYHRWAPQSGRRSPRRAGRSGASRDR